MFRDVQVKAVHLALGNVAVLGDAMLRQAVFCPRRGSS